MRRLGVAIMLGALFSAANAGPAHRKEKVMLKTDQDFLAAYRSYLGKIHKPVTDISEEPRYRSGDWRYFSRGTRPGDKHEEAALSSAGDIVDHSHQSGWHAFLSQSLPPEKLAERYCWLHGAMALVQPGESFRDPGIAPLIEKAKLAPGPGGVLTFSFWATSPPEMEHPYRVTLKVPPNGPATAESVDWNKLNKPKKQEEEKKDLIDLKL